MSKWVQTRTAKDSAPKKRRTNAENNTTPYHHSSSSKIDDRGSSAQRRKRREDTPRRCCSRSTLAVEYLQLLKASRPCTSGKRTNIIIITPCGSTSRLFLSRRRGCCFWWWYFGNSCRIAGRTASASRLLGGILCRHRLVRVWLTPRSPR